MHEAFWNGLFDVRWEDAPLGPDAIRLVLRLCAREYSERTCRDYGHAVVHLGRVLSEELEGVDGIRDDWVVEDFLGRHLPGCCCYRRPPGRREEQVRRGLAHLLAMLREEGALGPVVSEEPLYHDLLEGYCRFLRRDRGLAETTVVNYRRYLRDFLVSRGTTISPAQLVQLIAEDLRAFGRWRGAALGRTAWNHLATALSGALRAYLGQRDDRDQPDAPLFLSAHGKRITRFGVGTILQRHIAVAATRQPSLAVKPISPLTQEGSCEFDLYLLCSKFFTTTGHAPGSVPGSSCSTS